MRQAGVPLQRVRPALEVLAREIGLVHALASRARYTDGAELLFDYARQAKGSDAHVAGERMGPPLTAEQMAEIAVELATDPTYDADAYLVTAAGLAPAP